ncbi:MAG: hypothetical protein ABIK65_07495 [Candidatus Eisenbacteria bacterium]
MVLIRESPVPVVLLLLAFLVSSPLAAPPAADDPLALEVAIGFFLREEGARRETLARAEGRITGEANAIAELLGAGAPEVAAVLRREIRQNLEAKRGLRAPGGKEFPMSPDEILRTVVEYEIFKMRTYLTSGVFPKRYFGYVDRKWDTAAEEATLLGLTHEVVREINAWQEGRGRSVRLADAEVIVTWIAEGGALLLREDTHLLAPGGEPRIDVSYRLGCDNMGLALDRYPDLARRLDERFGTALVGSGRKEGRGGTGDREIGIGRRVDFRESIVAMAIMVLFEKEIAAAKLHRRAEAGGAGKWDELSDLPFDEQFILSSLVFNTGILFPSSWVESIRDFGTIHRLYSLSEENSKKRGGEWRPALPVEASPPVAFDALSRKGYREQPTSWQGAYHILQRYGAWVALREFTDLFDGEGNLR